MTGPAVGRRRMGPRDRDESHRAATPLELLFDLCWVYRYRVERAVARFSVTAFLVLVAAAATPPLTLALTVALIGLTVAGLVAADIVRPPRRRAANRLRQ